MKRFMTENEMETYLEKQGYNIKTNDEENVIDSTLVSEFAVQLGYDVEMNEKTWKNEFTLQI